MSFTTLLILTYIIMSAGLLSLLGENTKQSVPYYCLSLR